MRGRENGRERESEVSSEKRIWGKKWRGPLKILKYFEFEMGMEVEISVIPLVL